VRLYSRNAYDWTVRPSAIAAAEGQELLTIDGEAVVLGPEGLSRFEELSREEAAHTAILYAFDLIEHDSDDIRNRPFLDRKVALAGYCAIPRLSSYSTNTSSKTAPMVFAHACRLGAEGTVSKKVDGRYRSGSCRVRIEVYNPARIAVQPGAQRDCNR
jgi:bifunctional non-homologous end joining protein LigD